MYGYSTRLVPKIDRSKDFLSSSGTTRNKLSGMTTEPVSTPVELELPKRQSRTALLCFPAWVPVLWAIVLIVIDKLIKPEYAHAYLKFKPVLYTTSISAIIAPLCWIAAAVGLQRARPATTFQKTLVALSGVVILATWFALWRYGHN